MTLKEKLEFLAKHTDNSDFEIKNEYDYWVTVRITNISYMSLSQLMNRELREIERK